MYSIKTMAELEQHIETQEDLEDIEGIPRDYEIQQYNEEKSQFLDEIGDLEKMYKENPENYNETDPIVIFDPTYTEPLVMTMYMNDSENGTTDNPANSLNSVKDDAIRIPIVRINNYRVPDARLKYFKLTCDDFLPKLYLKIEDHDNYIISTDSSGLVNKITIIITPEINGYYKKISLDFFITNMTKDGLDLIYEGIFKLNSLNSSNMYMIRNNGSSNLNTYDFLYQIAKINQLGFAATEDCEFIKDNLPRIISSKNYIDFIKEQLSFSGKFTETEKAIYDCWVDLRGYLVLINLYDVLNNKYVTWDYLVTYAMGNTHSVESTGPEVQPFLSYRQITNKEFDYFQHNLFYKTENVENIINNSEIYKDGSLITNWTMSSPCNKNLISNDQTAIIENSVNGIENSNLYEYEKTNFLGIEFGTDTSVLSQKIINKKFYDKIKSKKLKIQLERYNLGLDRGRLISVQFLDYDKNIQNANNTSFNTNNSVEVSATGQQNIYIPGLYYIDGVEFEYEPKTHQIIQYLYLIRKSIAFTTEDMWNQKISGDNEE